MKVFEDTTDDEYEGHEEPRGRRRMLSESERNTNNTIRYESDDDVDEKKDDIQEKQQRNKSEEMNGDEGLEARYNEMNLKKNTKGKCFKENLFIRVILLFISLAKTQERLIECGRFCI